MAGNAAAIWMSSLLRPPPGCSGLGSDRPRPPVALCEGRWPGPGDDPQPPAVGRADGSSPTSGPDRRGPEGERTTQEPQRHRHPWGSGRGTAEHRPTALGHPRPPRRATVGLPWAPGHPPRSFRPPCGRQRPHGGGGGARRPPRPGPSPRCTPHPATPGSGPPGQASQVDGVTISDSRLARGERSDDARGPRACPPGTGTSMRPQDLRGASGRPVRPRPSTADHGGRCSRGGSRPTTVDSPVTGADPPTVGGTERRRGPVIPDRGRPPTSAPGPVAGRDRPSTTGPRPSELTAWVRRTAATERRSAVGLLGSDGAPVGATQLALLVRGASDGDAHATRPADEAEVPGPCALGRAAGTSRPGHRRRGAPTPSTTGRRCGSADLRPRSSRWRSLVTWIPVPDSGRSRGRTDQGDRRRGRPRTPSLARRRPPSGRRRRALRRSSGPPGCSGAGRDGHRHRRRGGGSGVAPAGRVGTPPVQGVGAVRPGTTCRSGTHAEHGTERPHTLVPPATCSRSAEGLHGRERSHVPRETPRRGVRPQDVEESVDNLHGTFNGRGRVRTGDGGSAPRRGGGTTGDRARPGGAGCRSRPRPSRWSPPPGRGAPGPPDPSGRRCHRAAR